MSWLYDLGCCCGRRCLQFGVCEELTDDSEWSVPFSITLDDPYHAPDVVIDHVFPLVLENNPDIQCAWTNGPYPADTVIPPTATISTPFIEEIVLSIGPTYATLLVKIWRYGSGVNAPYDYFLIYKLPIASWVCAGPNTLPFDSVGWWTGSGTPDAYPPSVTVTLDTP